MQRWLILVLTCLGINGCMDLAVRLEVKPNGAVNGSIQLEMLDQSYSQLSAMASSMGTDISLLDRETLEKHLADYDGTLKSYQNTVEEGVRKVHMEAHVKKGQEWLNSLADGTFSLKKDTDSWQMIFLDSELGKTMSTMDKGLVEQQLAMVMPMMSGLNWKVEMVVPALLDTNMEKVDGSTARFLFNFDQEMADKEPAQAVEAFLGFLQPKWVRFNGMK